MSMNTSGYWAVAYRTNSSSPRARKWYYVARVVNVDGKWWELYRWDREGAKIAATGSGGNVSHGGNSRKAMRECALNAGLELLHGMFTGAPAPRQGPELVRII